MQELDNIEEKKMMSESKKSQDEGNIKENYNTTSYIMLSLLKNSYIFRLKTVSWMVVQ